jgi:hypothetical protein
MGRSSAMAARTCSMIIWSSDGMLGLSVMVSKMSVGITWTSKSAASQRWAPGDRPRAGAAAWEAQQKMARW